MSLVAYAASSGEESDYDEDHANTAQDDVPSQTTQNSSLISINGHISDEDFCPVKVGGGAFQYKKLSLKLPAPKKKVESKTIDEDLEVTPQFSKLPIPKTLADKKEQIVEEDDEFLHKAAIPLETPSPPQSVKAPVKITIPSLSEFKDVDRDRQGILKPRASYKPSKESSLLSILPPAKSERNFVKTTDDKTVSTKVTSLIPDTVKNRRPAHNTEYVEKGNVPIKKPVPQPKPLVTCSDSDASDSEENRDFFSLNSKANLPEVSANEINMMVAQKAAQMAETAAKHLESLQKEETYFEVEDTTNTIKHSDDQLEESAIKALVGHRSKRRKRNDEPIQVVNISSDQVLPNREEWMRTALASSTSYQPTGVLVDEEPAAGTRRKHQITYLAHKAKANEAELQAMWAENRQNRRATQGKYGF